MQTLVGRHLTADIAGNVVDYLALEFDASAPYNSFVFDDRSQADEIRGLLFSSGACEYAPPFGQALVEDGNVIGMIACLTGKQLSSIRLRAALVLNKAGVFTRYPTMQRRLQLAGQTLLKP